jgi:hypothetical protein
MMLATDSGPNVATRRANSAACPAPCFVPSSRCTLRLRVCCSKKPQCGQYRWWVVPSKTTREGSRTTLLRR